MLQIAVQVSWCRLQIMITVASTFASALFRLLYWLHYCSYHYNCDCFGWPGPSLIVAVIVITSFSYKYITKLLCNPRHVAIQAQL